MSEQKTFINEAYFDEKVFGDGGSIIKVDIKNTDDFIKFLKDNRREDKSLKFVISKKKKLEEGKSSHYAYLDTWQPTTKKQPTQTPAKEVAKSPKKLIAQETDEDLI